MHACEVLSADGLSFVLENGAEPADERGNRRAPAAMILQTYSRYPAAKHRCLETLARFGFEFPDTPTMAFHRGRLDLLEAHLKRDPGLFNRRFSYSEIYPRELGCGERSSAEGLHGTPFDGGTKAQETVTGTVTSATTISTVTPNVAVCGPASITVRVRVTLASGVSTETATPLATFTAPTTSWSPCFAGA